MRDALTFFDGALAFTLAPLIACSVAALALIADALIRMATTRKIRGRIGGQVEAALEAERFLAEQETLNGPDQSKTEGVKAAEESEKATDAA